MQAINETLLNKPAVKKFLDKQKKLVEAGTCRWCNERVDLSNDGITVQILSLAAAGEDISLYEGHHAFHATKTQNCEGWSEIARWTQTDQAFGEFVSELTSGELTRNTVGRWTFKTK